MGKIEHTQKCGKCDRTNALREINFRLSNHRKLHGRKYEQCTLKKIIWTSAPAAYGRSQARGRIRAAVAYTTAATTLDPSHICNLCHSLQQHWILNPLSEAWDQICILMKTSRVLNPLSHNGNSLNNVLQCNSIWLNKQFLFWSSALDY